MPPTNTEVGLALIISFLLILGIESYLHFVNREPKLTQRWELED